MSWRTKKVLYVDLSKRESEVKSHPDLSDFIGGVGLAAKLMLDFEGEHPLIFSVGPLNGFFPFASKTAVFFKDAGELTDIYLGGSLSTRLRFAGLDALVLNGRSKEPVVLDVMDGKASFKAMGIDMGTLGLPGKRSVLEVDVEKVALDGYFETHENVLHKQMIQRNLRAFVVTGSKTFEIKDEERYAEIYDQILQKVDDMTVEKAGKPSCSGCPLGCLKSKVGEKGGDVLVHSLVACSFAEKIYSDENIVFSCLNALGYGYTHEDIENFSKLVYDVLDRLR
jgi:aldehyde:ferredoxin oxidoreductase